MLLQTISRLQESAYADWEHVDEHLLSVLDIVNPDAVSKASTYGTVIWKNILFYSVLLVLADIIPKEMFEKQNLRQ